LIFLPAQRSLSLRSTPVSFGKRFRLFSLWLLSPFAYFPPAWGVAIGSIASSKKGYPMPVQSKAASSTPQRAAERNRRQREHALELRQRSQVHQLLEQVRAQRKLWESQQRLSDQVSTAKWHGLLAKVKSLRAAGRGRSTAARRVEQIRSQNQQRRRR
jgi:hypothetical protein